ncbi:MAG TPA: hypothetical protein VGQ76_19405 [Thermoanaerobaculia bacterium]|nr:hypothetical protein [Thermoanaerobaculia bacterium]
MKQSIRLYTLFVSLFALLAIAPAGFAQCTTQFAAQPSPPSGDEVLIDDALPAGATVSTGTVNLDTSQYATGSQSFYLSGSGTNTVRIDDLSAFYKFGAGKAVLYVLIDECNPTQQIRITYRSLHREVAVYWGANLIGGGLQFNRGALPSTGVWTRFEIPLNTPLSLRGHTLESLEFQTYDGRVWFDHIGTDGVGCTPATASAPSIPPGDTVWVDDSIPVGAYLSHGYFGTQQKAEGTQSLRYPYFGQLVTGVVRVVDFSEPTSSGDDLVVYVMPTGCETLRELKITWYAGASSGSVWYGTLGPPAIGGEGSAVFISATVPAADTWTRIAIPAATVGLDGATITGFKVENIGSQVWVDHVGSAP